MIDGNSEKMVHLCARVQKLAVDLYKLTSQQSKLDEFMVNDIQHSTVRLYTSSTELCEKEDSFFHEVSVFGGLRLHLMSLNSQLLMCFQLGMLNSDVCIDFGYQLEKLKNETQEYYTEAKKEADSKNPFKDFDMDEEE